MISSVGANAKWFNNIGFIISEILTTYMSIFSNTI